MKLFKSFFQRFNLFKSGNTNQRAGSLSYLKSKLQAISFFPSRRDGQFRLIAPKNEQINLLPQQQQLLNQNISQMGQFNQLQSLSQLQHSQNGLQYNQELQAFEQTLSESNYQLLFKGVPTLNLRVIQRWSDIPALAPIKDVLSKHFGEQLTPLQKVVLPSLLQGENHVIQHAADQATRMLFLIPAFMYLLQMDFKEEKEVSVLILAKDEEQVQLVNSDIQHLQFVFQQGLDVQNYQQYILIDTPQNLLSKLQQNKVNLKFIKYFVVSDLTAMQDMGYAQDIVAVNSYINVDKQMVIVSENLKNDYLVIDSIMADFKCYVFVLSSYAQAMLEDYALKASLWTIILLLTIISYLTYKLTRKDNKKSQK